MKHVFWLLDSLLVGRPGPTLAPWDLTELSKAGLRAILSLGDEPDPGTILAAGLRHHSIPLPPILPLTRPVQDSLLRRLEDVLATLHAEVSSGQPVLVHCYSGKDRTGLALTAYLVRFHGLDIETAIDQVRAVRRIALSAPGYEATARRFAVREGLSKDND